MTRTSKTLALAIAASFLLSTGAPAFAAIGVDPNAVLAESAAIVLADASKKEIRKKRREERRAARKAKREARRAKRQERREAASEAEESD